MSLRNLTAKQRQNLVQLGITSPIQLLYFFPKSVQFIEKQTFFSELTEGVFEAVVLSEPTVFRRAKTAFARFKVEVNGHELAVICFNQTYLKGLLFVGMTIVIVAKKAKLNWIVSKVYYKNLDDIGTESVYPLLKGMRQATFRQYISAAFEVVEIDNFIAERYHEKYRLISRKTAFIYMHIPQNGKQKQQAIRYFKYEEAYLFYLNLFLRKQQQQIQKKPTLKQIDVLSYHVIAESLPFPLTQAQQQVIDEIIAEFKGEHIMHRLIQGDVGSGKTIVALIAAFLQIKAGYQVALLAPTTILAEQHYHEAQKRLASLGVKIGLLRSKTTKKIRDQLITAIAQHEIDLIVGTHALLEEDVQFSKIGLGIVDEQQRFGVQQRKLLRHKGEAVDILYLSATPIPRTLAISLFGDLDISTLNELPAGRQKIETKVVKKDQWHQVVDRIKYTTSQQEQVYVVCPLIEASETMEVGNLLAVHQMLLKDLPAHIHVAMLHGKQKNDEKQQIIQDFSQNIINVLVSTTVVEVGVHVDNATLMVIYDAQQFGLSQLHQLRGRVGRSERKAACLLVSDFGSQRLKLLEQSQDGFYLSQKDLEMRGPGDFFGAKQSGVPTFQLLDLVEDETILSCAKEDVLETLAEVSGKDNDKLVKYIASKQAMLTDFID